MVVLVNKSRQKNIYFNLVFSEVYISDVFHSVFFSKVSKLLNYLVFHFLKVDNEI